MKLSELSDVCQLMKMCRGTRGVLVKTEALAPPLV